MPVRSPSECCPKAAVSVSEMAKLCNLSRSRFYELVESGIMPQPVYSIINRRPIYTRDMMEVCLRVKSTNVGLDGQYVLFYSRRNVNPAPGTTPRDRRVTRSGSQGQNHAELIEGLRALGLPSVTDAQVDAAVRHLFPGGHGGMDEGEVLRALWRHLRGLSTA